MNKKIPYDELARIISRRSICNVQVGAVIYDSYGVFAWGWNSSGPDGYGLCAERMAIRRASRTRLPGSTILVLSIRRAKQICSLPCPVCGAVIKSAGIAKVVCANTNGEWLTYRI